jgi:hypothetical protein
MDPRELELLFFVSFLASFGFIRTSAHMIRAQVSWWPGNVEVGGTHIHHLVWGILLLLVSGYVAGVVRPDEPWSHVAVIGFGIGAGLTMDEFALWLNLRDVYWEEEGRRSIDAVIVVTILAGLAVTGLRAWIDAAESVETEVFAAVGAIGGVGLLSALVNASKEKFGIALAGLFIPVVGLAGAFRLGRPTSLWARAFYSEAKLLDARERFSRA